VRLTRITRTAAFRLAALYAAVFGVSVLVLGGAVYGITHGALKRQFDDRIKVESAELVAEYRAGGLDRLRTIVEERRNAPSWWRFRYRLSASDGTLIANNLDAPNPLEPGWLTVKHSEGGVPARSRMRVFTTGLDSRYLLSIASSASSIDDAERALMETFAWVFLVMLLLGLGGGLFISSRFLARVESITSAAQSIIDGNFKRRVPVRGTNDDLDRLAQTLNIMLDRINELMESLRQVSSDIAHDLRTPLSRLRHRLEAVAGTQHTEAQLRDAIAAAISDTDDILATFSALLRISQIEAGTRRSAFAEIDFSQIVNDVAEAYAPSIQDEGKQLILSVAPGSSLVGDRELLTQLVANLLENAIRHTPTGTKIEVSVGAHEGDVVLAVADDGPGVPAEARERLFDRFYRLERSRTSPGSGLGLSLAKAVCDLHDATIAFDDNGPGLRVEVRFPAPAAPAPAPGTP
jgi:signal transduction histidine kinase